MENELVIDYDEMVKFILDTATKYGANFSEDDVNLVLELELDYLRSKGIAD